MAGNQTLDKTSLNACRICTAAGVTNVPIAAGCDRPLAGDLVDGGFIHGESGLDGWDFGPIAVTLDDRHAVTAMRVGSAELRRPRAGLLIRRGWRRVRGVAARLERSPTNSTVDGIRTGARMARTTG